MRSISVKCHMTCQTHQIWDLRSWKQVCSLAENRDFISDMVVDEGASTLLATSGDGSLVAVDVRQRRLLQRSDTNESELLSLAIVKVSGTTTRLTGMTGFLANRMGARLCVATGKGHS